MIKIAILIAELEADIGWLKCSHFQFNFISFSSLYMQLLVKDTIEN